MVGGHGAPERTCIGCRQSGPKAAFVRIVRSPDGSVRRDPTGKAPGRGAYIHPDRVCARAAAGRLARALRADVGPVEVGNLLSDIVEGAP